MNQNIENIDYNFLNLPSQIEMADIDGISKNNFMQYHYLSDGQKLSQKVFTNGEVSTTRDYCGRFVYENGKLSYIIHADGVVRAVYGTPGGGSVQINPEMGITIMPADGGEVLSGFTREIHLKDHLGNVRAVFDYSKLQSENHYYPFGLPIHNLCTSTAPEGKENRYLYNGKELQDDLDLNWMDYGARFYDAGIGRWHSVDPMADSLVFISPYNYALNNQVIFVDPDGAYPVITITNQKTGATADQRVIGYSGGVTTQVDLYRVTVKDTEDANFSMTFSVTRDAWTVEQGSGNTASNVAFEPKDGNVNHYTGKVMSNGYPEGNGTAALKITQKDSEVVHAESNQASVNMGYRTKSDIAAGVMIHVGGNYNKNGSNKVAASEGCFGIVNPNNSSKNQSNSYSNNILNTIIKQANSSQTNPGHIRIIIEKREGNDYPKTKTIP